MIHTLHGTSEPRRRIGVIQIPRAQKSRLGTIRYGQAGTGPNATNLTAWTTLSNITPGTPEQWQALILDRQRAAQAQTPGTLTYTPAPPNPSGATVQAPWADWNTGECNPQAGSITAIGVPAPTVISADTVPEPRNSNWLVVAALLGAAAFFAERSRR